MVLQHEVLYRWESQNKSKHSGYDLLWRKQFDKSEGRHVQIIKRYKPSQFISLEEWPRLDPHKVVERKCRWRQIHYILVRNVSQVRGWCEFSVTQDWQRGSVDLRLQSVQIPRWFQLWPWRWWRGHLKNHRVCARTKLILEPDSHSVNSALPSCISLNPFHLLLIYRLAN